MRERRVIKKAIGIVRERKSKRDSYTHMQTNRKGGERETGRQRQTESTIVSTVSANCVNIILSNR